MIDFRYHVVSIVAVFLALTVGLVLGASFLSKYAVDGLRSNITSLTAEKNSLQQENRSLNNTQDQNNAYINSTAATMVSGYLDNTGVTVVQFAGMDSGSTAATVNLLGAAGATVTSNITINAALTDPNNSTTLTTAVESNMPAGQTAVGSTPQIQAVNLLAEALTAPNASTDGLAGQPVTPPATGMTMAAAAATLNYFAEDGLITVNTPQNPAETVRPSLAFLAAPTSANTSAQNTAFLTLAEALRADNAAPVIGGSAVGGSTGSSQEGGLLYAVLNNGTASKEISTVDNMNLTMGQVAIIFALYQAVNDPPASAGHYGTIGATDGQLPKLPMRPSPSPTSTATPGAGTTGSVPGSTTASPTPTH